MASYVHHRKATFDYEILERHEAGIELLGHEVKSVRAGRATLEGGHGIIRGGELYATGITIQPYQPANIKDTYIPDRTRRLLISKKEIRELDEKLKNKGLTLVPISLYNKGSKIKVELGLARGKKKFDKRETIKKRDTERELNRQYKAR